MNRTLRKITTTALPTVAAVALALVGATATAQSEEVLSLDIKPQKAGPALVRLATTSGVQIMLTEGAGQETEVEGLKGEYRFEEALVAMLTDTGLDYEFTSANVVLVQQAQEDDAAEPDAAADEPATAEEEEPLELEKQVVTGFTPCRRRSKRPGLQLHGGGHRGARACPPWRSFSARCHGLIRPLPRRPTPACILTVPIRTKNT